MPYLPRLLQKIDSFHSLAESLTRLKRMAQRTWTMPDDPEEEETTEETNEGGGLYRHIISTANTLPQDVANEVLLIGELYKRALEINGGYVPLNKAISVALSNIDSLIDDGSLDENSREAAEDLLEEVAADVRQRAKTSISQRMDEPTAMRELRAVQQKFNSQEAAEEMARQRQVYEKGKPGQEAGHGIAAPTVLETPQKYARELARLKDMMENDQSISLNVPPSERAANQNIRTSITELMGSLEGLLKTMPVVQALADELKITPDDQEKVKRFEQATNSLVRLRARRQILKARLNRVMQAKEMEDLESQSVRARTPAEKAWLEEKIKLQRARLSTNLYKGNEIRARQKLVNALGTLDSQGDFQALTPSPKLREDLEAEIAAGKAQQITKEKYDRAQSIERAVEMGKEKDRVVKRPDRKGKKERRGGGIAGEPINDYKTELATFNGLVDKLSEKINTAAHVARLGVTREKDKTHNALKPYVDALSKAIQKKDNKAKYEAIKNLKQQMDNWKDRSPAVRALEKNVRLLPFFNKYKSELLNIAKWQDADGKWNLDNTKRTYIDSVLGDLTRLKNIYQEHYTKPGRMGLFYEGALSHLSKVVDRLKQDLGETE